jgi:hypothetical protein
MASGAPATVASAGSEIVGTGASVGATVVFVRAEERRRGAKPLSEEIDLASFRFLSAILGGFPSFPSWVPDYSIKPPTSIPQKSYVVESSNFRDSTLFQGCYKAGTTPLVCYA